MTTNTTIPQQLQNSGFHFVPLHKKNYNNPTEKKPTYKRKVPVGKWKDPADHLDYQQAMTYEQQGGNVGVFCGFNNLMVIDFDTTGSFFEACKPHLPTTMVVKTGGRGFQYYYRNTNTASYSGILFVKSLTEKDENGESLHLGEFRYSNGYVVSVPSIHPNGNQYEVFADNPIVELPEENIKAIYSINGVSVENNEPASKLQMKPKDVSFVDEDKEESDEELDKMTLKQIEWRLNLIPADSYDTWLKVGWTLHKCFGGTDEAFAVFDEWSKKSAKYTSQQDCREKVWNTFHKVSEPLTLRYILRLYYDKVNEYYQGIYNDANREGKLFHDYIALKNTMYLIKLRDGYKTASRSDVIKALKDRLLSENVVPRDRAIAHIIDNLFLVKDLLPYVSVLDTGIHNLGGDLFLVEKKHSVINPVKGEWNNINNLISTTMPEKCREWLYTYLQRSIRHYMDGDMNSKGQAVFIIGEGETGKSTIAKIIQRCMGQHTAGISKVMMGDNTFNKELLNHPIWSIDDSLERPSRVTVKAAQEKVREFIKMSTVQSPLTFTTKFKDNITVSEIFRRLVVTLNDKVDILENLPIDANDITDKYSLLTCVHKFDKYGDFDENLLWNELPAFVYFLLNEWVKPDWIETNTRMGIASYKEPSVVAKIFKSSKEKSLLDDIELISDKSPNTKLQGLAKDIYNKLNDIVHSYQLNVRAFAKMNLTNFGHALGKLEQQSPDIVSSRTLHGQTIWTIKFQSDEETTMVVDSL